MKLAHSLNRTVLVSIPAFFGDDKMRACTLVDVETAGLWLACDELKDRLGPAHEISAAWTAPVTGFFPFSQILYVVDPSQFAVLARGPRKPTPPGPAAPTAPKDVSRERAHREGGLKQKKSKVRR
jgi:hypothetical protein